MLSKANQSKVTVTPGNIQNKEMFSEEPFIPSLFISKDYLPENGRVVYTVFNSLHHYLLTLLESTDIRYGTTYIYVYTIAMYMYVSFIYIYFVYKYIVTLLS